MIRPGIRRLFRLGVRRRALIERELDEEIRAHLEMRAERLEREGLSAEEAWAEAVRRFGPPESRAELKRRALRREARLGVGEWLAALGQDVWYAARGVWREPWLTGVVVLVIALGVGANAAVFGIVDRLLLRGPAHVEAPESVTRLYYTAAIPGVGEFTSPTFGHVSYDLLRAVQSFAGVASYSVGDETLGVGEGAEEVSAGWASPDLFGLLGTRAAHGRFFDAREDSVGAQVVVLGHGLWQRRFGGARDVLGRVVQVGGAPHTVIGVAPAGFTGPQSGPVDLWLPMMLRSRGVGEDWRTTWYSQWLNLVARLAPGVTAEAAHADATRVFQAAYDGTEESLKEARIRALPLWHDRNGEEAMEVAVARWLLGLSLVVLLVACANVTNLLLARALRHRREIAVRLALGIPRARLVRLLVLQGVLLAALGGLGALLVIPLAGSVIRGTLLPEVDWTGAALDGRVLAVAALLTVVAGVATGLVPALQSTRRDLSDALKAGAREGGGRTSRVRTFLTVAQAALSVVLLVGAGLFTTSLRNARTVDLGLEPERIIAISASWPSAPADASDETRVARRTRATSFYERALGEARMLPDVAAASLVIGTPFRSSYQVRLRALGQDSIPRLPGGGPYVQAVAPGYFEVAGLRLLRGRVFETGDRAGSEAVAVVNETMARSLWPAEDALGQCLVVGTPDAAPPCTRVVGIVEDAHRFQLEEEPAMQYYVPFGQERGMGGTTLLVRPTDGTPTEALFPALRRALGAVDPTVLWLDTRVLANELDPVLRPWRLGALVVGAFGLLALVIASIGLYSLIAYRVAGQRHEMGVRLALGARGGDLLRLVLRQGLTLGGAGLALGVLAAVLLAPRLDALLFRTSPHDPAIYAAVVGVLAAAALLACLVPARRAARVDPAVALRDE